MKKTLLEKAIDTLNKCDNSTYIEMLNDLINGEQNAMAIDMLESYGEEELQEFINKYK